MPRHHAPKVALLVLCVTASLSCAGRRYAPPPPPPPGQAPTPEPPPPGQALAPEPPVPPDEEPLPVQVVGEPIVVAAWAEPRQLPAGGGQAQILVRVQKETGGRRLAGVEVRLRTSSGVLYSGGRVLVTDAQGMTRDRLTTRASAVITLNAGGTRYLLPVPVAEVP
jgi:hypothetical protein